MTVRRLSNSELAGYENSLANVRAITECLRRLILDHGHNPETLENLAIIAQNTAAIKTNFIAEMNRRKQESQNGNDCN